MYFDYELRHRYDNLRRAVAALLDKLVEGGVLDAEDQELINVWLHDA
jgi:hypothetical protein